MANLVNTWIGYFDRTFEQGREAILTRLGVTAPEISDHTSSNPLIIIMDIFLAISELLHYYIDNAAREVYLHSARQYKSGNKIAKLFNYRLRGYSASSALVRFYSEQPVAAPTVIPIGTVVKAGDITFTTTQSVTIPIGGTEVEVLVIQRTPKQETFISDGTLNQAIELPFNTVDKSLTVTVNNIQYSFKDNFYLSNSTDIHFTTFISEEQKFYLLLGNGVNAVAPLLNSNIVVDFYVCQGSTGNVATGEIDTVETALNTSETIMVSNTIYASGGAEIESLRRLQRSIPASLRTLNRAVTDSDFKDIAEMDSGVAQAFVSYDCGAAVDVYIVPTGLGGATQVLIDSVRSLFYDETRLIMMDVNILPAGRLSARIEATLRVLDVYNNELVTIAVRENLKNFLSAESQEISGNVYIGDIYQIIENTEGVAHCELQLLSTIPEATIIAGNTVLNWNRILSPNSTDQVRWGIKYIGDDEYELRNETVFVGTFPIGSLITLSELSFTVEAGDYVVGDSWEFVTYPYNGTIELDEPSIVTIEDENINLTTSGGV